MGEDEEENKKKWKYRWKLEILPLLIIILIPILGFILIFIGITYNIETIISYFFILLSIFILIIFFWLVMYCIFEFIFWIKTKNPGHQLQFLAAILIITVIFVFLLIFAIIIYRFEYISVDSRLYELMTIHQLIYSISFIFAIVVGLVGYYNKRYRAGDIDIYRNIVVREGESINDLTDGYSKRVTSKHYNEISQISKKDFNSITKKFGRSMALEGFFIDWEKNNGIVKYYLISYTGIGKFNLRLAFSQLWNILKFKENLTWISFNNNGNVSAHISEIDYNRINKPVAYHILCENLMDSIVTSFIFYYQDRKDLAVEFLQSGNKDCLESNNNSNRKKSYVKKSPRYFPKFALVVTLILLIANISIVPIAWDITQRPNVRIIDVEYYPMNPKYGDEIYITATIKGLSHANIYVSIEPYLEGFYYFTDYGSIFLNMIHIENGKWQGVINASFPNGTELALRVFLSYTDSTVSDPVEDPFNSEITIFSDEIKIPIGHIDRSDISQLRIGGISNYVSDNVYENNVFQVRITSNENITSAILLMNSDGRIFNEELHIYYFWENYNYNMIKNSDGIYEAFTPAVNISMVEWINEYKKIIVYNQFKIVATDESGNVAATEGFYFENEIDE